MSTPQEIEQKIIEQRTIEANKKGLLGQNGKVSIVLKAFGEPIITQNEYGNSLNLENNIDEDLEFRNAEDYLNKIPIMDIEGVNRPEGAEWSTVSEPNFYETHKVGFYLSALSQGVHLEIYYDDYTNELSLYYKGYLVFRESKGELSAYVPNDEWENWVFEKFKKAKEKLRRLKEEEFKSKIEKAEKTKIAWWEGIKSKWGI